MKPEIRRIIALSDLLAKSEEIKRSIKLPHGADESDSHHAFSLAIIAYDVCTQHKLKVDMEKILLFALVHDLLEIVTGDEATLMMSDEELEAKYEREQRATTELEALMQDYPDILRALHDYERLDTVEAATIFVLDKACTTWTHFHDNGANLNDLGVTTKQDMTAWHEKLMRKIKKRLQVQPPAEIMNILHGSFDAMMDELFTEERQWDKL